MRLLYRYALVLCLILLITIPCIFIINLVHSGIASKPIIQYETETITSINISTTNQDCRFHSCFNILRCQPNSKWEIKIYVYPEKRYTNSKGKSIFPKMSYEFESILYALRRSKYITDNPLEACLLVPSFDILAENGLNINEVSSVLSHLPFWNNGENHILFNFFPRLPIPISTSLNIGIGNALLASSNMLSSNYRQGFDISIPLFNSLTVKDPKTHNLSPQPRKWKLVVSQLSVMVYQRNILRKIEDNDPDVLLLRKCLGSPVDSFHYNTLCKDGTAFSYPDILADGTFCLILPSHYYGSTLFLDALMMGCIPVIAMDEYILPFNEFIDWKLISVQIREYQLPHVITILNKLTAEEIKEKRQKAFCIWRRYFSTIGNIVESVFDVYNERVFVHKKQSYEKWNDPFGCDIGSVAMGTTNHVAAKPPIFIPMAPAEVLGFTAVILTYNRVEMLFMLMKELEKVPSLNKILIVWNNPYSDPYENEFPHINKAWKLIKMKTNSLTNRFFPFKYIETEAVMAIDDDILMLTPDEIEFAYQAWREYPDRLVGFPARAFETVSNELINGKILKYKYASEWRNELSMVLTGAAIYHKVYNHWFTYMLPVKTRNYIDTKMNCEDIGMNFLIANLTGKAPIKVTPRKRFKCAQCSGNDSLWSESSHFIKRSECLSVFTKHFGSMPLQPIEFRVDPLLFQEAVPQKEKAFPNVGMV